MNRRRILTGLLAAPMLIRTPGLIMPVRAVEVARGPESDLLVRVISASPYKPSVVVRWRDGATGLEMRQRIAFNASLVGAIARLPTRLAAGSQLIGVTLDGLAAAASADVARVISCA